MTRLSILFLFLLLHCACQQDDNTQSAVLPPSKAYEQVSRPEYDLFRPRTEPAAVLILFGGYPETAEDIQREFKILDSAMEKKLAIIYSNHNRTLWFEDHAMEGLTGRLQALFHEHAIPHENVFLGGFSSGGNVALLLGDHLAQNEAMGWAPKGIFIIDSPIDLAELYFSSELNLKRNFSEPSIQESSWLIDELGSRFGNPHDDLSRYEAHSVFTLKTDNSDNIKHLKTTKIRLYTEPDSLWWRENRMVDQGRLLRRVISLVHKGGPHSSSVSSRLVL